MIKRLNKQLHSDVSAGRRQERSEAQDAARIPQDVRRLATADRQRLFRGLERFVNTDDSVEEYNALGRGWPGFWPRTLVDCHGNSLAWHDDCDKLFLVFRHQLRYVWTPLPDKLKRGAVCFLLGIGGEFERLESGGVPLLPAPGLMEAWEKIKKHGPSGSDTSRPLPHPQWARGELSYLPGNEFQRALYLLFRESWRAKICARCSTYFVASKPPQLYCGTACSGGVKRERALTWWREKGAARRAARTKAGRQLARQANPKSQRKRGK